MVRQMGLPRGGRLLDVGTGTGVLIPHYREVGVGEVVGVDLSRAMLRQARARFPKAQFLQADFYDLPEGLGPFDAVVFNAVFANLYHQQRALRKAAALLTPGGRAVISHPMGRRFVHQLHRQDLAVVPHLLPGRRLAQRLLAVAGLEMVTWLDEPELYLMVAILPG